MNYLFDTNIVLLYVKDWKVRQLINSNYKPFKNGNKALLSVVTIGELKSLAQRNQWCLKRVQELKDFLERFIIIDVSSEPLLDAYADIENFSQGKHETRKLKTSARNMGKMIYACPETSVGLPQQLLLRNPNSSQWTKIFLI
jgi:hypothetical protein